MPFLMFAGHELLRRLDAPFSGGWPTQRLPDTCDCAPDQSSPFGACLQTHGEELSLSLWRPLLDERFALGANAPSSWSLSSSMLEHPSHKFLFLVSSIMRSSSSFARPWFRMTSTIARMLRPVFTQQPALLGEAWAYACPSRASRSVSCVVTTPPAAKPLVPPEARLGSTLLLLTALAEHSCSHGGRYST